MHSTHATYRWKNVKRQPKTDRFVSHHPKAKLMIWEISYCARLLDYITQTKQRIIEKRNSKMPHTLTHSLTLMCQKKLKTKNKSDMIVEHEKFIESRNGTFTLNVIGLNQIVPSLRAKLSDKIKKKNREFDRTYDAQHTHTHHTHSETRSTLNVHTIEMANICWRN